MPLAIKVNECKKYGLSILKNGRLELQAHRWWLSATPRNCSKKKFETFRAVYNREQRLEV